MRPKLLALIILLAGAPAARADNLDEAKAAFAAGKAAFQRGEYETALAQFQRANLLAPAPSLSYNIGTTYEKMGRYRDAVLAFERYLELAGAPQSDDDKKFQEELKQRIENDRKQPDRPQGQKGQPPPPPPPGQPPPQQYQYQQPPPQQYQYQPQPYGYNPYGYNPYAYQQPVLQPKEVRLGEARRKRNSGIATFSVGAFFFITGLALTVDAFINPHPLGNSLRSDPIDNVGNIIEVAFGIPFLILGPILVGTGAGSWGKYQGEMNKIAKEPGPKASHMFPSTIPASSNVRAAIFSLPAVTF